MKYDNQLDVSKFLSKENLPIINRNILTPQAKVTTSKQHIGHLRETCVLFYLHQLYNVTYTYKDGNLMK